MKALFSVTIILAGFLLSSPVVMGQSKFAFSITAAPFYGQIKSKNSFVIPSGTGGEPITTEIKSKTTTKGYWVGLNGRYSFSSKWSASTGLWLSESWQNVPQITPAISVYTGRSRSHNLAIPAMVNFQTSERRLSPYFSAGAMWNFSTTSRLNISSLETNFTFKSNDSKVTPMVGAGVIYNFAQHISMIAQPIFQYIIPLSGIHSQTYQLNLNVQLMYRF
ncbi:outer membrane beta-barrel protein [Dyadobacter subterraneus]|uniref:Outer membrane beta-barrel protein n=1 Tax=Dyadobacter subterraneus TaxID=2773304 RepID=A0ABR9WDC1_9BACT|nr:outer membrane beta-barrel protein [Dyadobacter subterraneus]MBE9463483.1 outer membrane beta-barrel protein [Dyadobacter subterraneus]